MLEASGWRINNIGEANIIILKQLIIKEVDSDYKSHIHFIIAAIWSQKKILKAKKFQSRLHITKLAGRNSEKLIANQVL